MDKFQYYNRKTNEWEDYTLISGWNENFVLDKTTDNATVKIKEQSLEMPEFDIGDWCRILHLAENETQATYTQIIIDGGFAYIPLNHEQYFIKNFQMVKDEVNGEIDIQLDLGEPIELTNGIVCETMSFTNQTLKTVDGKTYIHEPLNHYSVLEKILKVTPSNNDLQKSWYSRIKIIDKEFLQNLPFNDETYSEPTLYNILLDKYDSNTGRTPVIYFDINGETDKPFNTNRTEYVLKFERQDGFDKEVIELNDLINDSAEVIKNKTFSNFAQGVVSNFDNLSPSEKTTFISEKLWFVPEVNNNNRDLSIYNANSEKGIWIVKTPHLIKNVEKVRKLYYKFDPPLIGPPTLTRKTEEIPVFDEKQYNADDAYFDKRNCCWFTEGSNEIHLNDYYYVANPGVSAIHGCSVYQIEYTALISGRIEKGNDFKVIINQTDSQIDNEKFGKYLENYLASMNKADFIISKTVENWNDIKEIGSRVIDNLKNYLITNIGIENRGFDYNVTYQLNENHLRRNDSIVAPQEIRKNIEIGIETTKERKTNFNELVKLSLNEHTTINSFDKKSLFSSLLTEIIDKTQYPQTAYFKFKSILTKDDNTTEDLEIERIAEITKSIVWNSICYNMKYIDNAEAGKNKFIEKFYIFDTSAPDIYMYDSPKSQIPVLYTDYFGEIQKFDCLFVNVGIDDLEDASYTGYSFNEMRKIINETNKYIEFQANYPYADAVRDSETTTYLSSTNNINYYKDMLDIFNFTFGLNYETDENIILCRALFKNSILITIENKGIYALKTYSQNMQENDFYNATPIVSELISSSIINNNEITITLANTIDTAKCIALVDDNNNPVIIINDFDKTQSESFNNLKLYC